MNIQIYGVSPGDAYHYFSQALPSQAQFAHSRLIQSEETQQIACRLPAIEAEAISIEFKRHRHFSCLHEGFSHFRICHSSHALSLSLSFGFFTVPKRNRERMHEEERAHCTQSDDAAAAAAKRKATKRSISPTVIVQRMRRREGEKSRNYGPAATSPGSSTGNDS